MQFYTIDHLDLSKQEKHDMAILMATGASIIEYYHEAASALIKESGSKMRYYRVNFRQELFSILSKRTGNMLNNQPVTIRDVVIPNSDIMAINALRKVEFRIMQGYAKLMFQHAKKWSQRGGTSIGFDDFYNEIVLTVMNSIYCYTNTKIQFTTFTVTAIQRRMAFFVSQYKQLSHWTNDDKDLYNEYQETRIKAEAKNGNVPMRLEEIMAIMKLDADDQERLRDMLKSVIRESDIVSHDDDNAVDITAFAKVEERGTLDMDIKDILKQMEMTEWEKAVLDAYLQSPVGGGWRAEVASKFINPETGKNYSRAAPKIALDRLLVRIKTKYETLKKAA